VPTQKERRAPNTRPPVKSQDPQGGKSGMKRESEGGAGAQSGSSGRPGIKR
jgi:hypothetical protein